jgi:transcription elongation factor GreA
MQVPIRKAGKYTFIPKDPHISQKGFDQLSKELKSIKKKLPKAREETHIHAQMGDFSENAEYQAAKRRMRGLNSAAERIEKKLNTAIIIPDDTPTDTLSIGHTVTLLFNGTKQIFTILGSDEADPTKKIISHLSPIGKELLGKKKNEIFTIQINGKNNSCEILDIQLTK